MPRLTFIRIALLALLWACVPLAEALAAPPAPRPGKPRSVHRVRPKPPAKRNRRRRVRRQRSRPKLFPKTRRTMAQAFKPPAAGKKVKVAFFDADGTLRVTRSGKPAANSPRDVVILPMVAKKIKALADKGYLIAIVSNQAGVEAGYISERTANAALKHTARQLSKLGAPVHYYDYAPRSNNQRKPATGMAGLLESTVTARYKREIDWKRSFMVGDAGWKKGVDAEPSGRVGEDFSNSDRVFAENIRKERGARGGMKFHHARDFFGWTGMGTRGFANAAAVESFVKAHPQHDPGIN